jgi:phosphoribosylformimino-5-aminoimidazole carboxamide ribotide isomerase
MVVPAIDLRGGRCVRLLRGDPAAETAYSDDPISVARRFEAEGASLLHVVDLDAALGEGSNRDLVGAICREVSIPVQTGGGLRSLDDVDDVLRLGAARAVLGTQAVLDRWFVGTAVERHGEAIVVAVDALEGRAMIRGWRDAGPPIARLLAELPAPRFLVTGIASDGTLEGPDLALYEDVRAQTDRPVLASGGVRTLPDVRALAAVGVEGVVVGKALYEGTLSLAEVLAR